MIFKKLKKAVLESTEKALNKDYADKLFSSLEKNINMFKEFFKDDDTFIYRSFENQENKKIKCCVFYIEGMAKNDAIYDGIIRPIIENRSLTGTKNNLDFLYSKVIVSNNLKKTASLNKMFEFLLDGDALLLMDGECEGIIIESKDRKTRAIEEPESEKSTKAPREGFTESMLINLSLLRRKIKTQDLKLNFRTLGVRSHTKICICYIKGITNEKILKTLNKRLDDIDIDAVLASNYIMEMISDHPASIFETIGYTERPDIIAAKLLEGRIAIFTDGTPFVLTVPHIFIEYFQANDDYYEGFYGGSIVRLLRIFGFIMTITIPALYVSVTAFHQEMIPTPLLLSIVAARKGIPIPISVEALSMLIIFEILKEAGARMPTYIGQALSIVGALVIGQAAVEARFVSAPMVIVIAFTSITSLMISRIKTPALILRIIYLLAASFFGIYGMLAATIGLLIHLSGVHSFGVPYMANLDVVSFNFQDLKDTYIRAPWWYMKKRPEFIAVKNIIRKSSKGRRKV